MRTFWDNRSKQLKEFFGKMSRKDKTKLAILAAAVVVLAIVAVVLLNRTNYVTLYTADNDSEAGKVLEALQAMGEDATVQGTRILVPENRADELRTKLAYQGVTVSDEFNYDHLNSAAGFNITEAQAKKLYEAQAAAEIKAQILQSSKIQSAMPTVKFGESSPFLVSDSLRDATAAVMLVVKDGATLTKAEVQAIAELVRTSVPGIRDENISITDSNLRSYKIGEDETEPVADINDQVSKRIALTNLLSQQIKTQVEQLLMPIFGTKGVSVAVTVGLNFDKRTTESVVFAPPVSGELDGIVRSSSELYESTRDADAAGGVPGTDTNGLGTVEYPYITLADGEQYRRALIEKNYEINETRDIIEHEQGSIESLNVAVSIDSEATTEDYTSNVSNLVAAGLGVTADNVAVESMPFAYHAELEKAQADNAAYDEQAKRRETLQMIIMWAVILLLGLAFISLIKSIVKAAKGPVPVEPMLASGGDVDYDYDDTGDGGIDYLADEDVSGVIESEEIELNKKSSGLEQIEKFIDKDPAAVALLLRNWLTED